MKKITKTLLESLKEPSIVKEASDMESTIDEAARYLFDEGDKDYLPDWEEFKDYTMDISKPLFDKAKERALKALTTLAEHNYVSDNKTYLELSDNHTIFELNNEDRDLEDWVSIIENKFETFEQKTGTEIYQAGRSGRHIVVEPTYDNCMNYDYLKEVQEELEQEAIQEFNTKEEINESVDEHEAPEELDTLVRTKIKENGGRLPDEIEYKGKIYKCFNVMSHETSGDKSLVYYCNMDKTPSGDPQESDDYFFVNTTLKLNPDGNGFKGVRDINYIEDLTESSFTEVDNDPDLNPEEVQSEVDYWTDVDNSRTEDVSGREPIGVYTVSNSQAIYVYDIKYDIDDMVLAGDSSDTTKAKWRYIIFDDGDPYFYYGDIKVPFNEVIKTNI